MAGEAPRGASGLKAFLERIDAAVDSALNRTFDPTKPVSAAAETKRAGRFAFSRILGAAGAASRTSRRLARIERRGRKHIRSLTASRYSASPVDKIIAHPFMTGVAVLFIALLLSAPAVFLFGSPALGIRSGMRADLEVFLPPDDPATKILSDIRQNFSTELLIGLVDLYVEDANITAVQWLRQISGFEGDLDPEYRNASGDPTGVDWRLDDVGYIDGVMWPLSIPTIVKIANVSTANFLREANKLYGWPPENLIPNATYAVPNDQSFIDSIIDQIDPAQRNSLIINRDGDASKPYNRLVVLFGLTRDPDQQDLVIARAAELAKAFNEKNGGNIVIRLTGPVIVFRDLQKGVSAELGKAIIPIVLGLMGVLYFWHRNWRVWLITLLPVALASGMTYGIVGAAHILNPDGVILAPQVVLAAPVLLALGVSYGLYISNRFMEETKGSRQERTAEAVRRINPAIFLSAATTGIGFFSLMIGTLPPIWTLGLALTIGISLTYIFTYALVPVIIVLFGYEKRAAFKDWSRMRDVPERKRIAIVALSLALVASSLGILAAGQVSFDVDYLTMTPAGTASVDAMRDYSSTMGGGQLGMVQARGDMKDVDALDAIEGLEDKLGLVPNVQAISMVTVMKLVRSPSEVVIAGQTVQLPADASFWDLLHAFEGNPTAQEQLLSLFYGTIPIETRSMLVNPDLRVTLVYIFMPFLAVDATKAAVNDVNAAIDAQAPSTSTELQVVHMAGIQTVTVAVNDLIITSQIISLIVAIALTWSILFVTFGSWKIAAMACIPVAVVTALEPLVLVGLSVPLSTVTVMIGSIAIGTGVDFSIQIAQRTRLGGYTQEAVNEAVEKAGVSFVEATSTMVAGFAGMFAMNIVAIQQFVLMIIALLTLNMIMALFLFPAVLSMWIRRRRSAPPPESLFRRLRRSMRGPPQKPKPVQAGERAEPLR